MGIGHELRQARRHAGLSAEQIAEHSKAHAVSFFSQPTSPHNVEIIATAEGDPLRNFPAEADVPVSSAAPADAQVAGAAPRRRSPVPMLALAVCTLLAAFAIGMYPHSGTRAVSDARADGSPGSTSASPPTMPKAESSDDQETRADAPERADRSRCGGWAPTATRASSGDVTGAWSATTRVDSASVDRYQGLRLGYRLNLQQSGNQITGTGFKTAENGWALKAKARTPITLE